MSVCKILMQWGIFDAKKVISKGLKQLLKNYVAPDVSGEFLCITCHDVRPCGLNFKMKKLLFQGAESRIYQETYLGRDMLVKERFNKNYRHPELDNHLTKERIKAECRNIVRCKQFGIRTPAIYFVDLENRLIYMEYFKSSITVKEHLQNLEKEGDLSIDKTKGIAELIGQSIANMHCNNIIHGDLTTSNFLLTNHQEPNKSELVVIDFGLSHSEASDEDKAVDLNDCRSFYGKRLKPRKQGNKPTEQKYRRQGKTLKVIVKPGTLNLITVYDSDSQPPFVLGTHLITYTLEIM